MKNNQFLQSLILLTLILLGLLLYQFVYPKLDIVNTHFRSTSFFIDKKITTADTVVDVLPDSISLDSLLMGEELTEIVDTVTAILEINKTRGLKHFRESLDQLKSGKRDKVRVAWFGDSMIEGDLIVKSIRSFLQKEFGGAGVGMMGITSKVNKFRSSIKHDFSENWVTRNMVVDSNLQFPLGFYGSYFTGTPAVDSLWVEYKGTTRIWKGEEFEKVYLYYGAMRVPSDSLNEDSLFKAKMDTVSRFYMNGVKISLADTTIDTFLRGEELVNRMLLAEKVKELRLDFDIDDRLPIYGLSFESSKGVIIDNYASRGNSGMPLASLDRALQLKANETLKYDMIVLQYGSNVLNAKRENFSGYGRAMERVIASFQSRFPSVSILLISVGDRSIKEETEMITDPSVARIKLAQQQAAIKKGIAYFDLQKAMGGDGSMKTWVEKELANKDYTHFNYKGADSVGRMIHRYILKKENFNEAP